MRIRYLFLLVISCMVACNNTEPEAPPKEAESGETAKVEPKANPSEVAKSDMAESTPAESAPAESATADAKPSKPATPEWLAGIDLTTVAIREEMDRVQEIFTGQRKAFIEKYNAASADDKKKMRSEYPSGEEFVKHAKELLEVRADDPELSSVYAFLVTNDRADAEKWTSTLFEKYPKSKDFMDMYFPLVYGKASQETEDRIQIMLDSPHADVQGMGAYIKAEYLGGLEEKKKNIEENPEYADRIGDADYLAKVEVDSAEIERLYQLVVDKHGDIKFRDKPLRETVEGALFELAHLSVGKEAPDIEAEDIDGETFALSDYRGKVVMLDFWGDW